MPGAHVWQRTVEVPAGLPASGVSIPSTAPERHHRPNHSTPHRTSNAGGLIHAPTQAHNISSTKPVKTPPIHGNAGAAGTSKPAPTSVLPLNPHPHPPSAQLPAKRRIETTFPSSSIAAGTSPAAAGNPAPDGSIPWKKRRKSGPPALPAAQLASMLAAKEAEMKDLAQKVLQKQIAELQLKQRKQQEERQRKQAIEAECVAASKQHQHLETEARKRKELLSKGFSSLSNGSSGVIPDENSCNSRPETEAGGRSQPVADEAEVRRVLDCKDDYACLLLKPGAGAMQVKGAYRRLALGVHPDKCSHKGAGLAFQRITTAYQSLLKRMQG